MQETVFRSYTAEQGETYAENRNDYRPELYQLIIDHHTSTGGQLDTIIDVGCGPGTAIRALAPRFTHAIGLDPSAGMLSTARAKGGAAAASEPIRFEISAAEELGSELSAPIPNASVDLITAATAAHWFDMKRFWPRAAEVLKPGGTVALWCGCGPLIHPSTPNHIAIQAALGDLDDSLKPHFEPGNVTTRTMYKDLLLPWTIDEAVEDFDKGKFFRKTWNEDGAGDERGEFFFSHRTANSVVLEKAMGTSSPVARWRKAHPDVVGTEQDIVRMTRRKVDKLLHEAGVEPGQETILTGMSGVLLMFKKTL